MRNLILLAIVSICFSNCSNSLSDSEQNVARNFSVTSNNNAGNHVEQNLALQPSETPKVDTNKSKIVRNFRVDSYEDNELVSSSFFRNGLLVKDVGYNTQTKKIESEVKYFYKKDGKFDHAKVGLAFASKDADLEADKSVSDFVVQRDFLKEKGIEFPLPALATEDISYISEVFSVAENYHDFKTDTRTDGNQKVIRFIDFNKKIRFEPTTIEGIVGNNPILIKDYELILENNFPIKETYKTDNGELTKTYSYKDGKLTAIVYQFAYLENQINSLTKRFEYSELK